MFGYEINPRLDPFTGFTRPTAPSPGLELSLDLV